MILPIIAFGAPILRKQCVNITADYPDLDYLLANMWETMYAASGVGLAAPQINKAISLFMIDTKPFLDDVSNNKHKDHDSAFKNSAASMFFDEEVEQQVEGEFDEVMEQALDSLVEEL